MSIQHILASTAEMKSIMQVEGIFPLHDSSGANKQVTMRFSIHPLEPTAVRALPFFKRL